MPRAQLSQTGRIVNFFRTAELQVAALVLDLCKDAVLERKHKSEVARARAIAPAVPATAQAAGPKKKAAPKKRKKAKVRKPVNVALPLDEQGPLDDTAGDAGDAPVS